MFIDDIQLLEEARKTIMADGLNQVNLLGNIGKAPMLRYTQDGTAVLNFDIATTSSYLDRNKERQERTEWNRVVIWGKRGEALSKLIHGGSKIFVQGRLQTSSYEKDGEKHYKTEVVAEHVILCDGRRDNTLEHGEDPKLAAAKPVEAYPF